MCISLIMCDHFLSIFVYNSVSYITFLHLGMYFAAFEINLLLQSLTKNTKQVLNDRYNQSLYKWILSKSEIFLSYNVVFHCYFYFRFIECQARNNYKNVNNIKIYQRIKRSIHVCYFLWEWLFFHLLLWSVVVRMLYLILSHSFSKTYLLLFSHLFCYHIFSFIK